MSHKEVQRAQVLDQLKEGKINQQQASKVMCVSTRQVRRLAKHYLEAGLAGLDWSARSVVEP